MEATERSSTDDRAPEPARATTRPSSQTREAEREDAEVQAGPDRPPTEAEARAAPTEVTDEQREHEREMLERGARQEGEGRIA
jgi:hypothetical protein